MSDDVVKDTREVVEEGHMNELKNLFREPYQASMPKEEIEKARELYHIATQQDKEDPIGWIKEFNASTPINLDIGNSFTRVGKVLEMAKAYLVSQENRYDGFKPFQKNRRK